LRFKFTECVAHALGVAGALVLLAPLRASGQGVTGWNEVVLPREVVTGTHIPMVEGATALPVQIITREEIERANIQTAAQLVNTISASTSYSSFNEARGLGNAMAGFAGGALRGLGYQFTVVLVNGRRIANYAFTTRGADLNAIPLSAVERVEVLRDGASAIYGADAIGGVINFILRKDYRGAEASAQYTSPEHTGGYGKRLTAWAGFGDPATQGFNAYANVDYQKFGGIRARDRSFAARSFIPEEGVDRTLPESVPANVLTPAGLRNPTGDPGNGYANPSCAPPLSSPTTASPYQCRWFGDGTATIIDPSEQLHLVGSLTWQFDRDHQLFLSGTWARNRFTFITAPTAVSSQTTSGGISHFLLPPTSAFYPHDFANAFGIDDAPLDVSWRSQELGAQTTKPTSEQWNVVAGMQGVAAGWSYNSGLNYSRSAVDARYADGFARESLLIPILNSGIVNPFGPNTPEVVARISAAKIDGVLTTGKSTLASFDFRAAKDVLSLPAGPVALAAGFDAFHEKLTQRVDSALASADVLNTQAFVPFSGSRDVWAAFAEANIPLLATLEANVAVRYDHYSDFGGTTNPKVSLRWQPVASLMTRASAGTGFLAPSLSGLFTPTAPGATVNPLDDPARCPYTSSPQDCGRRFPTLNGGNPGLQPVTSRQWSAGGIWSPTRDFSLGVDYVWILLHNRINFFAPPDILRVCPDGITGPTCYLIHRGIDPQHPTLPGPIVQIDQFVTNLGSKKVSAVDVDVRYAAPAQTWGELRISLNGTFNIEHLEQQVDGSYVDLVDKYSTSGGNPGVIPRWRHYLVLDWSRGPWSATLTENYQTGAYEQLPRMPTRRIGDYDVWNLGFSYAGFRDWTVSAGIKNLFDRDPPFSNQNSTVQVGYDPSYGDPRGRLYWIGASYALR
jgi:iron complex outermembrane receptor protein